MNEPKKALVVSRNLLGDSLYIQMAVKKWQSLHPDWQLDLLTHDNYIAALYYGMGIDWHHIWFEDCEFTDASEYDSKFELGAGTAGTIAERKRCHIAEAYADMMGVELDEPWVETPLGRFRAIHPVFNPEQAIRAALNLQQGTKTSWDRMRVVGYVKSPVLWSPFSVSCTSQERDKEGNLKGLPPNKMLLPEVWLDSIAYMRTLGPLRLLGSANEDVPEVWRLTLEETECLGLPLCETALLMRQSRLVVTVDNGMGHLAASQDASHVVFYPMCLGLHFIVPWGSPFTVPIQMHPPAITGAMALSYIERSVRHLDRQRSLRSRVDSGETESGKDLT